jgi:glutaredoxin
MKLLRLTFYTKDHCSLCEKAFHLLQELRQEYGFELDVVDITQSEKAWEAFRHMVPVVSMAGEVKAFGRIDEDELRAILQTLA